MESFTARFSTSVIPEGTAMMTRGATSDLRLWTSGWYRSMLSVMSKSAMTPSFRGRMATMEPGVRPSIFLASSPTASTLFVPGLHRHDGGPSNTIPSPFT